MKNYTLTITPENEEHLVYCKSVDQNPWLGDPCPGVRYRFRFPNRYEASVIKFFGSYGWEDDLWELGLCKSLCDDHYMIYNRDFPDVKGFLTDEEVNECLDRIRGYDDISTGEWWLSSADAFDEIMKEEEND